MAGITANSSLIQGSNRSGEAGCVLHDVREEEIVFRRVKTAMTINGANGVNGVHVCLCGVHVRKRRGLGLGPGRVEPRFFNPTSHVTNH